MNEGNNFNNQFNGGINNQMPQNNQGNNFNNQPNSAGPLPGMQQNNTIQPNTLPGMQQNNFNQANQFPGPMPTVGGAQKKNNTSIIIVAVVGIIVVVGIVYFVFFNTKKLSCTSHESSMGITSDSTFDLKFKNNKFSSMNAVITFDFGSMSTYKDQYLEIMKESYLEDISDTIKYSIKEDGNKVVMTFSASNTGAEIFDIDEDGDYDDIKEFLENNGYTCK